MAHSCPRSSRCTFSEIGLLFSVHFPNRSNYILTPTASVASQMDTFRLPEQYPNSLPTLWVSQGVHAPTTNGLGQGNATTPVTKLLIDLLIS